MSQKNNVKAVEQGYLITYKDNTCTFIRTSNLKKDGEKYYHNDPQVTRDT